uniref:Rhomboid protein Illhe_RBL15 n=1 Tax=Illicium henryi TaxID=114516 RepID=A0A0A7E6N0_9MAGN|nr:rhomboid protein Illhe_RBL15 [Illicium henryi]
MRSNIVTEAGLPTRLGQWWEGVPFITSGVLIVCGLIYLVCLLVGYDSFSEICFLPAAVIEHFQVYRIYTAVLFHGSLLHLMFNMLALVPLGSGLERIMGSVRLLHVILLLATSNALFHLLIVLLAAYNPLHPDPRLMNECAIGFSGIIFSMIVMETSLSGIQSRSVFGLFNVPAKWYAWILLIVFQLLMTNVSLLGHLCGILSGFAYIYGLFNYVLPGSSFYSAIESSSLLSACVRRPRFILGSGGTPNAYLPTSLNDTSSASSSGNIWRSLSSWMPQRETPAAEPSQDNHRFPGRGRTLGSISGPAPPAVNPNLGLQTRLLDDSRMGAQIPEGRGPAVESAAVGVDRHNQGLGSYDEEIRKLVAMGFEKSKAEVALAAADGDSNVAVEILMNQG